MPVSLLPEPMAGLPKWTGQFSRAAGFGRVSINFAHGAVGAINGVFDFGRPR
jgi:hypothetical protein